ncbi:DNA polymerase IV [Asticcacaulis sp. 201]|uniref:DNA polymerase IV n=1 Tax=Asticcacaulis sp. 201 TaxID=3028787 RepID=UPI0029164DB4|nr:DNA polymerase IV [Asticcacaulis sp. 201]MDV6332259.1 DNA polymerase IV [Asticcacaulis sp. 201]
MSQMVMDDEQPAPTRKIIHIDMDAFFASVEQRDSPDLRGKPVAVGGGSERGVVAAASYEARKFGVYSAMPSVTARRKCPDLIFVKHRFEVYKAVSRQIRDIFEDYTPLVEPLSLDEAYLDVTENLKGMSSATEIAEEIRARIWEATQLTASAGVSYNKFLAKLASDQNKPNGLFVIKPAMGPVFAAALPVKKFHGIGPATAAKMNRLGLFSGQDIRNQTLDFLEQHFGVSGRYYYGISRGIDHRQVKPNRERKSIGAENTFFTDTTDFDTAWSFLEPLIDKVWRYVDANQIKGRTVTLKVKFSDFRIITRSRSGLAPVANRAELTAFTRTLLEGVFPVAKGIRLLGVSMSSLGEKDHPQAEQLSLSL